MGGGGWTGRSADFPAQVPPGAQREPAIVDGLQHRIERDKGCEMAGALPAKWQVRTGPMEAWQGHRTRPSAPSLSSPPPPLWCSPWGQGGTVTLAVVPCAGAGGGGACRRGERARGGGFTARGQCISGSDFCRKTLHPSTGPSLHRPHSPTESRSNSCGPMEAVPRAPKHGLYTPAPVVESTGK